ncbi:hypothetical protein [Pseudothauera nasutitermitis]|uniref:hypothetical protein n=1 Tax=Pseudothauera nasutitermitis TaxID=2565930 RepID=UPI001B3B1C94|nr:hypothetical protein [Pseudothauera nasutitermitis]
MTGLALCWATLLLMRLWGKSERTAQWLAVLNMGLWLLHPYMVSTTLYVVQRMAQLATLFMFAGLAGYLHGRLLLPTRPRAAYAWMSCSVALGTLLAVLSKENGALLPLLICIVEFCQPVSYPYENKPDWRWRAVFLWLPALAILFYLAQRINFSPDLWPTRPFNQVERLMTQPRILWEYLYHLWVPRIEGRGLFQDGFLISRGWLSPPGTLVATIGLATLAALAIALRRTWPAFSLAILFFLSAHLIESSVIGLELYFEHRNYAAAAFLFLPIACALAWTAQHIRPTAAIAACCALLMLLSFFTWQRATLWGDTNKLQTYWALATPDSPRAQNYLAVQLFKQGRTAEGMHHLEQAAERLPHSSLLTMQWLLQRVSLGIAIEADFELAKQRLADQQFDAQAVLGLRMITEELITSKQSTAYRKWTLGLLESMDEYPHYRRVALFRRLSPYLRGLLLLAEHEATQATELLSIAMRRYADTDAAMSMVAHVANSGYPAEAMVLLAQAHEIYLAQPDRKLKRSRQIYDMEFERVENILKEDLKASKQHTPSVPGISRTID